MSQFIPSLGQACYGQPFARFECPQIMAAALEMIREEVRRVVLNRTQDTFFDPGANHGLAFRCDGLGLWAYSWGDDEQPYNFYHQKSGLKLSWYKWMGRGMSCNLDLKPHAVAEILRDCMETLQRVDDGAEFQHGGLDEVPYFEEPVPAEPRWPSGCIKPGSCGRNGMCMYALSAEACRHFGQDIRPDIEAASHGG